MNIDHQSLLGYLLKGAQQLNLPLTELQQNQFMIYLQALIKWNKIYNLTAIDEPQAIIIKHFLDSLSIAPYIQGENLLDVGTGAGFPGIPLAIIKSDIPIYLLDSNSKKTSFLLAMKAEIKLENLTIIHGRVEQQSGQYKFITSRAFSDLKNFIDLTSHLLAKNGCWLAMKGTIPHEEIVKLEADFEIQINKLNVPYLNDEERHLIIINKV